MPTRQRIVTYGVSSIAVATITVCALLQPWQRPEAEIGVQPLPPPSGRHAIDVVFAVDTTSSMSSLIDGAKRTVWSIATHIRKADPDADLRIGLVAYRDNDPNQPDKYVTKDFALTTDLDAAFRELSGYTADGGGDIPENVDAALYDAVHKMPWRQDAKKLVFLVGDAPPASRGDVPTFDVSAREAAEQHIVINTIRCGWDPDTERAWSQIASLGHGQFSTIREDGGVQQIATPMDDRMAELQNQIDRTAVIVGDEGQRGEYAANIAAAHAAAPAAKADRAAYYAEGGGGPGGDKDLVQGAASGSMDPATVAPSALPAELANLDKPALKAELERRASERAKAQQELSKLAKERDEYLQKRAKDGDGFDSKVKAAIDTQLK